MWDDYSRSHCLIDPFRPWNIGTLKIHNDTATCQALLVGPFMQETCVTCPKLFSQGKNQKGFDPIHPNSSWSSYKHGFRRPIPKMKRVVVIMREQRADWYNPGSNLGTALLQEVSVRWGAGRARDLGPHSGFDLISGGDESLLWSQGRASDHKTCLRREMSLPKYRRAKSTSFLAGMSWAMTPCTWYNNNRLMIMIIIIIAPYLWYRKGEVLWEWFIFVIQLEQKGNIYFF